MTCSTTAYSFNFQSWTIFDFFELFLNASLQTQSFHKITTLYILVIMTSADIKDYLFCLAIFNLLLKSSTKNIKMVYFFQYSICYPSFLVLHPSWLSLSLKYYFILEGNFKYCLKLIFNIMK